MLTTKGYEQALAMRSQGLTVKETAQRLGYHPTTIAKWIKVGGPPERRVRPAAAHVLNPQWAARVSELLTAEPQMSASKVRDVLTAEGFLGSYSSVVRYLRARRGPRFQPDAQ